MNNNVIELKLSVPYTEKELINKIKSQYSKYYKHSIVNKSLDARDKSNIHWKIKIELINKISNANNQHKKSNLETEFKKTNKKIIIVGSGPAGFFSAIILQSSGYKVEIIEQGKDINSRARDIEQFELTGRLNTSSNYTFGEGGAGTFSDGKLTSRTKKNKLEKQYVFDTLIEAGAPQEISYLSSPHLGSDNLKKIVKNLRAKFISLGGTISFNTKFINLKKKNNSINYIETNVRGLECDFLILAIGHSSYTTYNTLLNEGIPFKTKPFAIGSRVEHIQKLINKSQWGVLSLPGIKAAEYKLTHKSDINLPVYSFCMCPGGKIVPSSPQEEISIVNGMSNYKRNSKYANSAIVAGINLNQLYKKEISPREALNWLYNLENKFYKLKNNYSIPARKISDFLNNKPSVNIQDSSYPFEIFDYDFKELFPDKIYNSLIEGINKFKNKISGFEDGIIMGLESKTSSPIQVIRDRNGKVSTFDNLYMVGEGSGFAGGIVSSAIDGIKAALDIVKQK